MTQYDVQERDTQLCVKSLLPLGLFPSLSVSFYAVVCFGLAHARLSSSSQLSHGAHDDVCLSVGLSALPRCQFVCLRVSVATGPTTNTHKHTFVAVEKRQFSARPHFLVSANKCMYYIHTMALCSHLSCECIYTIVHLQCCSRRPIAGRRVRGALSSKRRTQLITMSGSSQTPAPPSTTPPPPHPRRCNCFAREGRSRKGTRRS